MDQIPGDLLRMARKKAKLSGAKLAAAVSPPTSASQIHKLEIGEVELTVTWAQRLAPALGIHYLELFGAVPKLASAEQELVDRVRSLDDDARETVLKVVDAFVHRK